MHVNLTVRLVEDPKLYTTAAGNPFARVRVVENVRRKGRDGEWTEESNWYDLKAWSRLAENAAESLRKGDLVTVTGELMQRKWTTATGEDRVTDEITASDIGASLRWATVTVQRNPRADAAAPSAPALASSPF